MKRVKLLCAAAAMSVMTTFTACNSDNEPMPKTFTDFATLTATTYTSMIFEVQKDTESEPVDLVWNTTSVNPAAYHVGDRFVITYSNESEKQYVAGPIEVYYLIGAFTSDIIKAPAKEIADYVGGDEKVEYYECVGKWLNIQVLARVDSKPKTLALFVDETTVNDPYPNVFLGFESDNSTAYYQRRMFGSYDLTPLFSLSTCKGINFYFNNSTKPVVIENSIKTIK